jgi:chromosomal replication initiation ATPase DnaA
MATQLNFDLPARTALGREDFFVAPSNALAVALLDAWATWPNGKLVLTGPEGSGKTHLVHVWADRMGAQIIRAADLTEDMVPALASAPVAVEDIPQITQDPQAQTALFHLHNLALAEGNPILLTGRSDPNHWALTLPDLQSRLAGTQTATLNAPDDALLAAVLAKLFSDRQIVPKPDVIPFLVKRMERSFEAANRIVAHLDHAALTEKKDLSRVAVAQWLQTM